MTCDPGMSAGERGAALTIGSAGVFLSVVRLRHGWANDYNLCVFRMPKDSGLLASSR